MDGLKNLLAEEANKQGSSVGTIIILCVLVLAIVGMFVWSSISNKKKKKEAEEKVSKLKIGDRVKTIGGVCGFIAELNDKENTFVLKTGMEGSWSFVKFDKAAIYQTAPANAVVDNSKKDTEKKEEVKEETKPSVKKSSTKKPTTKKAETKVKKEDKE
ncbi:MAG: preprotein translocase subunit YajC [Firmicutes bacterium]|nr:preprotein translocase subunit YajC [Candidatus Caballimonas caccae]